MIVDALRLLGSEEPDRVAVRFLASDSRAVSITYGALDHRARRLAAAIAAQTPADARVVLLLPPGLDYVAALFGVFYAGRVAVPAYPARGARGLPRVRAIVARAGASLAIAAGEDDDAGCPTTTVAALEAGAGELAAPIAPGQLALLQYTSGSTAAPKGVMVSHRNLAATSHNIARAFGSSRASAGVIWLPPYHDMGLVGGILHPIHVGFPVTLMAPTTFLQAPARWLRAIDAEEATISGGPNFAFDLCVDKIPEAERATFDLSRWSVAFSGAEPVRAATLERFAAAFASAGFSRRAFVPCYGLAESTLLVSAARRSDGPRVVDGHVDCGAPAEALAIVDPETRTRAAHGEVWVRGESVAAGYFGDAAASEEAFGATLAGETTRWLRTGDLGFVRDGGLFVSGRLKDLLVVRGRNVHPEDIETAAAAVTRSRAVAAFEDGGQVVVVAELPPRSTRPHAEIEDAIRRAVADATDVTIDTLVLVRFGGVPMTSSGKVRRAACRDALAQGALTVLARSGVARDDGSFAAAVAAALRRADVPRDVPLAALGLDSLAAVEIRALVEARGGAIALDAIADATVDALEACVGAVAVDGARAVAERPATWAERMMFAHHEEAPTSTAFHVVAWMPAVDEERLAAWASSPLFRTRFEVVDGTLMRKVDAPPFEVARVTCGATEVDAVARAAAFAPFDLGRGPLVRVVRITSEGRAHLLLAAHHSVADFRTLELLHQGGGRAIEREDADPAPALAFWREALDGALPVLDLPRRAPRRRQALRAAGTVRARGGRALAASVGATPFAILLVAWQIVLRRHAGQAESVVGVETAGRTRAGSFEALGSFVNPVAVRATLDEARTIAEHVRHVRPILAAALAHQDVPFPRVVDALGLQRDPAVPPVFQTTIQHYRGPLAEAALAFDAPHTPTELALLAAEDADGFALALRYDTALYDRATIELLARDLVAVLDAGADEPIAAVLARLDRTRLGVVCASTFTVDPLAHALAFWLREAGMPADVSVAPYDQLSKQLFDPESALRRADVPIVVVRPETFDEAWLPSLAGMVVAVTPSADPRLAPRRQHVLAATSGVDLALDDGETFDPEAEAVADAPFTREAFARMGTLLARAVRARRVPRRKVIAVDGDGTLWGGVVGEDGPHAVRTDGPFAALGRRLRAQRDAGALLVLASKNVTEDVRAVFDAHPEMELRWDDFARHAIGWGDKAASVRAIAAELGFGLDAFVFVDDSPVERAAMRAACPEVLVVPAEDLGDVWDLDRPRVTDEDRRRATLQREEDARVAAASVTGDDFVASLALVVDIAPIAEADVPRAAQLTQRTNQLTTTTRRLDERAVAALEEVWVVRVRDRFGDYGLVGVFALEARPDELVVPVFALSCRALGRGVEQRIAEKIGALAQARGRARVVWSYRRTARNVPAMALLGATDDEGTVVVAAGSPLPSRALDVARAAAPVPSSASSAYPVALLDRVLALREPAALLRAMQGARAARHATEPLAGTTEHALAAIWSDVLATPIAHADEDFFRAGGTSLDAAYVLARVRRELGVTLSVGALFAAPTLGALAKAIDAAPAADAPPSTTPAQRRILALAAAEPTNAAFHVAVALVLPPRVDLARVRDALAALIARHDALRTRFDAAGASIVDATATLRWETEHVETHDRDAWLAAKARQPFDLARAPLLRAHVATTEDASTLLVVAHHAIVDGASMHVLADELDDLLAGRPLLASASRVPAPQGDLARVVARLRGAPLAALPAARDARSSRAARVEVPIASSLRSRIATRASALGMSPFTFVHAVLSALVARWTGHDDVVTGVVLAGHGPDDRRVGMLARTVPVRILHDAGPLEAQLARARDALHQAYADADVPLEAIVREVAGATRELFTVMFVEHAAPRARGIGAITDVPVLGAQIDLLVVLRRGEHLVLDYRADAFSEAMMTRFGAQLVQLLDRFSEAPLDAPAHALDPWTPADHAWWARWNDTARARVLPPSIAAWFEMQVDRTPDRVALTFGDVSLSYRALDRRANAVAAQLQARGFGPGALVGVSLPRSLELVVALLGVLKSGAAYVPIDPELPEARRSAMAAHVATVIDAVDGAARDERLPSGATSADLAYVMFTSGSTGRPKGVMVEHRGVMNRLAWACETLPLDARDVVVQKTPFGFDVSVWEIFWPLVSGARLVVAKPGGHKDPAYLSALFVREGVTIAHFVPSMLGAMVDGALGGLRRLFTSGEALSPSLVNRVRARFPALPIHNLYGPTEASIEVTHWAAPVGARVDEVPIGRPITNTVLEILDPRGRRVPLGASGELAIGGVGVARGYLADPAETARRFVDGAYRTGDRVRLRDDGELLFLGRIDDQVKIRGVRIELDEVTGVLCKCLGVREGVVVARGDDEDRHLVAYAVPHDGAGRDPDAVRRAIAAALPSAMVPRHVVFLDALPVGPTGKVARDALPAPVLATRAGDAPRTPVEATLAAIWARVLGVPSVGRDASFFALGGDSILALRVVAQAKQEGLAVAVRDLVRHPTVAALADRVGIARDAPSPPPSPTATASQRAFFARAAELPNPSWWNQSVVIAVRADVAQLRAAVDAVVRAHPALRMRFEDGAPVVDEPTAASLEEAADDTFDDAFARAQRSLDVARGPVFRAVATPTGRLALVAHHLVVDAVSWRVVLADLMAALRGEAVPVTPFLTPSLPPRGPRPSMETLGFDRAGTATRLEVALDEADTGALLGLLERHADATIEDALLAAVVAASARPSLVVDREGHGRDEASARTVGWLTAITPIAVDGGASVPEMLANARRARMGAAHVAPLDEHDPIARELSFDYLGRLDERDEAGDLRVVAHQSALDRDPAAPRTHGLALVAWVRGGRLTLEWRFAEADEARARAWATRHHEALGATLAWLRGRTAEEGYPLTRAQEGMLLEAAVRPGLYVEQLVVEVSGPVDVDALRRAVDAVVARHPALRTRFDDGLQIVEPRADAELVVAPGPVDAFLDADRRRGFDVARGPLFRVAWVERTLVVTHHHAILDGWSLPIVMHDLFAAAKGRPLAPRGLPFRSVVRARDEAPVSAAYWEARLAGFEGTPTLPFALPPPRMHATQRQSRTRTLDRAFVGALEAFARRAGVTVATVALAAHAIVLARTADTPKVVFGVTTAGRDAATASTVGVLLETVPFAVDVGADALLHDVQRRLAEDVAHASLGLAAIRRTVGEAARFETLFVYESYPFEAWGDGENALASLRFVRDLEVPLALALLPRDPFLLEASFDPARVSEAAADAFLDAFVRVLRALVAGEAPEPFDRAVVSSAAPTADRRSLHVRVEDAARATPDAIAIDDGRDRVTYGHLVARAKGLARWLVARGVAKGAPVGVSAAPSIDLVVGALAAMFAGGAYLPLDPALPSARIATLVDEAKVGVVLRGEDFAHEGPTDVALPTVTADDRAYVLFTSGSTGAPKAIVCAHRGVLDLLDDMTARAPVGASASLWTTPSFDVSIYEIFSALSAGATLHVVPSALRDAPEALVDWLVEHGVASAYLPGRVLAVLAERSSHLRRLLVGVEPIDATLASRVLARSPSLTLVNGYGPTEASICATLHTVTPSSDATGRLPIGRAVRGATVRLVDRSGRAVPPGVAGEIVIEGEGVALERLGGASFEGRYRTGDRAAALPDGTLVFLGRADRQVKIHGVRVELGEIEATLAACPGVREVVAALTDEGSLVAWVEGATDADAVRAHARAHLPPVLVPAVVSLPALPRDPNGKIDRRALAYAAPTTPASTPYEARIAAIFRDVLGVDAIGRDDDFFARGGHSLAATRLVARVREAFGVELPLRDVFERPTVAGVAAAVAKASAAEPIVPMPEESPLSFAQERLWFVEKLSPGSAAYHLPCAVRIQRPLDVGALATALAAIVARHEPLRTAFVEIDGVPVQRVMPPVAVPLSRIAVATWEDALARACEAVAAPFDLGAAPLVRATVIDLADDDHLLVVTVHHIAADGWSAAIMLREIVAAYEGAPLPPLPIRYRDFAGWQRARLDGERRAALARFWTEALDRVPRLALPTTGRAAEGERGFHVGVTIDAAPAVEALARQLDATPFMTLLAALDVALARTCGTTDVPIGASFGDREHVAAEPLVGFFVNLVVVRARLDEAVSFADVVREVRRASLAAHAHRDMPFDRVVEAVRAPRTAGETPLFQVNFVYQGESPSLPPDIAPVFLETNTARFDFALSVERADDGYRATLEARAGRFDRASAEGLLATFARVVREASANPAIPWRSLAVGEGAWEHGPASEFDGALAHELVVPSDAIALARHQPDATLTYAALAARAHQLAHVLRSRGVTRETRVGVCLPRSFDAVVAILAVLEAGGAYVPLDPTYPAERLAFFVEDAAPAFVLATDATAEVLPAGAMVLVLEELPLGRAPSTPLPRLEGASDRDLAYLIYTSGSTGRPNGVAIEHRSLVNLARAQRASFGVTPSDRVLQFAPLAFDASVSEIFVTLAAGATLDLGADEARTDLADALEAVTMVTLPPSVLGALDRDRYPGLRTLIVAAEPCPPDLARRWAKGRRLLDAYGPTEATVCATVAEVDASVEDRVAIGRPIAGVEVGVVDPEGAPVPRGIAGEIVIGGAGVMRGYWRRPALDAARVVAGRYRTGDVGRFRADGALEILGRVDAQIKHHGFRIEPGEIEAALRAAGAADAVVAVREGRLVAWVLGPTSSDLAAALGEKLPAHMIPSAVFAVDAWPRTPSGKLDRDALVVPVDTSARDRTAPRSATEATLLELWAELLRVDPATIGVHDAFFERGGDSITSVQLVARARRRGLSFTVQEVFAHQTIAALAAVARTLVARAAATPVDERPFPLAPIQRWFFASDPPAPSHYNQSILLALETPRTLADVERAWAAVVARHDALRLRFSRDGATWSQRYGEAQVSCARVDVSGEADPSGAIEAHADAVQRTLDIENGIVSRVVLFDCGPDAPQRLLFVVHHLVVDALSFRFLLEDFFAPSHEPAGTSYAAWCAARAADDDEDERAFWRARRRGPFVTIEGGDAAAEAEVALDEAETATLLAAARPPFAADPQEMVLAAAARAFGGWTRGTLLVDVESHGRDGDDAVDVSRTVGWFTAVFPIPLECAPHRDAVATLRAVKEAIRSVPRGGIGAGFEGPRASIGMNYLGRLDGVALGVSLAKERAGRERPDGMPRPHALEIQAYVLGGTLRVRLVGPAEQPIARWAADIARCLRELVALSRAPETHAYVPADFPEAALDADTLASVLEEVLE